MIIDYYRIDPTGNITLLVKTPVPEQKRAETAALLMRAEPGAEQVGFISDKTLNMAGGEFCGNATLSAAAVYCLEHGLEEASPDLAVSGAQKPVHTVIKKTGENTYRGSVRMPAPVDIGEIKLNPGGRELTAPLIDFGGIAHIILTESADRDIIEKTIKETARGIGADCLGIMLASEGRLTPLVYVRNPETLVWESSCASGTSAAGIYFAMKNGGVFEGEFIEPGGTLGVSVKTESGGEPVILLSGTVITDKIRSLNLTI